MTIADFLRARLAEDEARARDAESGEWRNDKRHAIEADGTVVWDRDLKPDDAAFIVHNQPKRVLADIAAKRRIVEFYAVAMQEGDEPDVIHAYADVCEALASVYADHPDYRPEWAPESVSQP